MKVKDLMDELVKVDPNLEVAYSYDSHERWGKLYRVAQRVEVRPKQVHGPKMPVHVVLIIE